MMFKIFIILNLSFSIFRLLQKITHYVRNSIRHCHLDDFATRYIRKRITIAIVTNLALVPMPVGMFKVDIFITNFDISMTVYPIFMADAKVRYAYEYRKKNESIVCV